MTSYGNRWRSSATAATLALLGATAIWGGTFPVVKNAITPDGSMQVFDFLAWRFALATVAGLQHTPSSVSGFIPACSSCSRRW